MAKPLQNDKGFKVLTIDVDDLIKINSPGICDWCSEDVFTGKYIAVLNHIYCDKCYDEWYKQAKYYSQDKPIEDENYIRYSVLFNPELN